MDAKGRAYQNTPRFNKAISDFESSHGGAAKGLTFSRLQEPGQKISSSARIYIMEAVSPSHGRKLYRVRITFRDSAHTVASNAEILERVAN